MARNDDELDHFLKSFREGGSSPVSRRAFLQGSAALAAAASATAQSPILATLSEPVPASDQKIYLPHFNEDEQTLYQLVAPSGLKSEVFHRSPLPLEGMRLVVTRATNFLHATFTFKNASLHMHFGKPHLVLTDPAAKCASVTIHLPPQHQQEETFIEDNKGAGQVGQVPVRPVELTLSGESAFSYSLPIMKREGLPLTIENLLCGLESPDVNGCERVASAIELPYRTIIQSSEDSSTFYSSTKFDAAKPEAPPQLWHLALEGKPVTALKVERSNDIVTLSLSSVDGWQAFQTIGILEPATLAGDFVITSVDCTAKTIQFPQKGTDFERTSYPIVVANRFMATQALDSLPDVVGVQSSAGKVTFTFSAAPNIQAKGVINIALDPGEANGDGTYLVSAVSGNTLTYLVPAGYIAPKACSVSIANSIVCSSTNPSKDQVLCDRRMALHAGEGVRIFDTKTGLSSTWTVTKPDEPDEQSAGFFTTFLPGGAPLPAEAVLVPQKRYPVNGEDRHNLVKRSTNEHVSMAVDQLVFSALGAWFSAQATFMPASHIACPGGPPSTDTVGCNQTQLSFRPTSFEKYIYRMAQGRDYYVEVDQTGFLLPYGHEAVWLKITRRVFYTVKTDVNPAENICFLRQQIFVVVRQKSRTLRSATGYGHELPFRQVDILDPSTPALAAGLDVAYKSCDGDHGQTDYFWPALAANQLYSFKLRAFDGTDPRKAILFTQPLMFVNSNKTCLQSDVANWYNTSPAQWRQADFAGQAVHFADSARNGDTELHVGPMSFLVDPLDWTATNTDPNDKHPHPISYQPSYVLEHEPQIMNRPKLEWAAVDVPALRVFSGNSAAIPPTTSGAVESCPAPPPGTSAPLCLPPPIAIPAGYVKVNYDPLYIGNNFSQQNPAEVYLRIGETDHPEKSSAALGFPGQQGGGAATPTAKVGGLSRSHGLTNQQSKPGSTTSVTANVGFDPGTDFSLSGIEGFLEAKLLGCISLSEILPKVDDITSSLGNLPMLQLTKIYGLAQEAIAERDALLNDLQDARTKLKTATDTIDNAITQGINGATPAMKPLIDALTKYLMSLVGPTDSVAARDATNPACSPMPILSKFYQNVSNSLQTTLQTIETEVEKQVAQSGGQIAALLGEDYEKLRVAGDLDLQSQLWNSIYTTYVDKNVDRTVLVLETLRSRIEKDIFSAATKLLAREQRPLDQLWKALDQFIAVLEKIASGSIDANTLASLRTQATTLFNTLTRTLKQMKVDLTQSGIALGKTLYAEYYKYLLPQVAAVPTGLRKQFEGSITQVKSDIKTAVVAHQKAFKNLWSGTATSICDLHHIQPLPTLTQAFDTAIAEYTDVGLDCLFQLDAVQSAIGDAQQAFTTASSLAGTVLNDLNDALNEVNALQQKLEDLLDLLETPVAISGSYTLENIPLQDGPADNPIFLAHSGTSKAYLRIDATVSASATPINPTAITADYTVKAGIYDFSLSLLPSASFITVSFSEFSYTASRSAGTHFTCRLASVESVVLDEALGFVAQLASAFGPLGGGDDDDDDSGDDDGDDGGGGGGLKPIIHLAGFGLTVGFDLKFPSIEAGGFQIANLAFSIALAISFGNDPLKLQFFFARPDRHFLMSATIFGGGGFLGLELRPDGVDRVQGAMEFGACAGLDLGVAQGEVHIFGGIYFDFGDQRCILTGYVRAGGSMRIIEIITVSLEFYLGLTYEKDGNQTQVYGDCTLTVSISILFFHADVSVHMHWQWQGSPANHGSQPQRVAPADKRSLPLPGTETNPRLQQWDQSFWDKYTAAFR